MNRTLKRLCFVAIICLAHSHACADDTSMPVQRLTKILAPRVRTLDRKFLSFHYETPRADETLDVPAKVLNHLRYVVGRFVNPTLKSGDLVGLGLYVAIDPSATRSYGGADPVLFVVPIAQGARILDVTGETLPTDLAEARAVVSENNCKSSEPLSSLEDLPGALRNSESQFCRQIWIDTIAKLRADAISYSYIASHFGFGCRQRSEALNIISMNAIDRAQVSLYTNQKAFAASLQSTYIAQLYRFGRRNFNEQFSAESESTLAPPNTLAGRSIPLQALRSWVRREIYDCGPARSTESGPSEISRFAAAIEQFYSDATVQTAELAWIKAWRKKSGRHDQDLAIFGRISEIEHLNYVASGLAPDDSKLAQYQAAVDLNENYNLTDDEKVRQFSAALEEPVPAAVMSPNQALFVTILQQLNFQKAYPGVYPRLLQKAGVGPRFLRLQINSMLPSIGGPLFLTPQIPLGDTPADTALYEQNKSIYVEILNRCTALMNDPGQTIADIAKTSCAVRVRAP